MANRQNGAGLRQLRTLFNVGTIGELTDGQLLERFTTGRGEAPELAFAALVERHGPLVLRACRAVLRDEHDAQDAFQATFLVLVRKARSLWVRDSLGPWLHQVACRAAHCTRADRRRRRVHEREAAGMTSLEVAAGGDPEDFGGALHEEIARLPERYRSPIVLCDLEGCTHELAARYLGCPVGTVKSRLARGRERLRSRLVRRGLAPASASCAIGATLAARTARASVPASLAEATVRIARRAATGKAAGAVPASVAATADSVLATMSAAQVAGVASACLLTLAIAIGPEMLAPRRPEAAEPAVENRRSEAPGRADRARPEADPPADRDREGGTAPHPSATLEGHASPVWTAAFSPDGRTVATGSFGEDGHPAELKLWDAATGRESASVEEARSIRWVAFSPDGKILATAEHDGKAKLRNAADGAVLQVLVGHDSGLDTAAFSPDGRLLATTSWDRTVKLWDVEAALELRTLRGHTSEVYNVAFSPDGRTVASASRDWTAKLWDVATGADRLTLRGHRGVVHSVMFSPDGKTIATASWDRTVKLWDAASGRELTTLRGHTVQVLAVAFSPDGRLLASSSGRWGDRDEGPGPGELKLWDAATYAPLATIPAHAEKTFSVAFSPDGKRLATASWDRTVKLWEVGELLDGDAAR